MPAPGNTALVTLGGVGVNVGVTVGVFVGVLVTVDVAVAVDVVVGVEVGVDVEVEVGVAVHVGGRVFVGRGVRFTGVGHGIGLPAASKQAACASTTEAGRRKRHRMPILNEMNKICSFMASTPDIPAIQVWAIRSCQTAPQAHRYAWRSLRPAVHPSLHRKCRPRPRRFFHGSCQLWQ